VGEQTKLSYPYTQPLLRRQPRSGCCFYELSRFEVLPSPLQPQVCTGAVERRNVGTPEGIPTSGECGERERAAESMLAALSCITWDCWLLCHLVLVLLNSKIPLPKVYVFPVFGFGVNSNPSSPGEGRYDEMGMYMYIPSSIPSVTR